MVMDSAMRSGSVLEDLAQRMTMDGIDSARSLVMQGASLLHKQCGRPTEYADLEEPDSPTYCHAATPAASASESTSTRSSSASETSSRTSCSDAPSSALRLQKRRNRHGARGSKMSVVTVADESWGLDSAGSSANEDDFHYQI